jgi:GNAT superfamily N-acetyltransferase
MAKRGQISYNVGESTKRRGAPDAGRMYEKTVVPTDQRRNLLPLFQGVSVPSILRPVLYGAMGLACADRAERPKVCSLSIADVVMLAGDPGCAAAAYFVQTLAVPSYVLPSTKEWSRLVRAEHTGSVRAEIRREFGFTALNLNRLRRLAASVEPPFYLEPFNLASIESAAGERWSLDLVGNFESPEAYLRKGVGFCVVEQSGGGRKLVSGASSFSVLDDIVEFQVDTHPSYRRRGFAAAASARLALHCLEAGLTPHWDAANSASCALAEKLGFTAKQDYRILKLT